MVSPRSRRRLSPEARRGELIDAAIRVLESGQQVSNWVQAVAAEAGAAKGTFYVYFSSWDEMLLAVRDRVLRDYVERFTRIAASTEPLDWWATIDAECAAAVRTIARPGGLHEAAFHSSASLAPAEEELDVVAAVAKALRRGVDEGAFRPLDTHTAATILFTVIHGAADAIAAGEQPERWLAAIRDLTRHWLAPR
ncbi:TetR/AcrR family transcriptional regulator [Nonomuraea sp. MG754425]|uniref:TetR/AcrR family transcriptional regulator n=1 Tax=Nonomuraea sp. MG754425 TaxID=2570319 RepID=UPI001F36DAFD|nr:TetR/AcrR family transcriptional regulator [Nonomuraea sp. MG754425]MCF6468334.1 TetR/AcrR family transcriptional regulator [Nonomuraea sp. MG754425]